MNISNTMLIDTHTHTYTHTHTLSHSLTYLKTQHSAKVKPSKDKVPTAITHKSNPYNILALHPKPHTHYNLISRSKQTHTHPPTPTHTHQKRSNDQLSTTGGGISLDTNLLQTKPVPWCGRRIASTSGKHLHNNRLPLLGDVKSRINTHTQITYTTGSIDQSPIIHSKS